jgi:hypothetical protein
MSTSRQIGMDRMMIGVVREGRRSWMWRVDDLTDRHGHYQGTEATRRRAHQQAAQLATVLAFGRPANALAA